MTRARSPGQFDELIDIVGWARILTTGAGAALLVSRGAWDFQAGKVVIVLLGLRSAWAAIPIIRREAANVSNSAIDLMLPSLVAIVFGLSGQSILPLLAGILTAGFLVLPVKSGFKIAAIGLVPYAVHTAGVVPPLIVLEPDRVEFANQAATWLGIALLVGMVAPMAARMRTFNQRMSEASEAQRDAAVFRDRMISMISHELRTPLTTVRGFAELLLTEGADLTDGERTEFLSSISREANQLAQLVDDYLIYMRAEAGALPMSLETTAVEAIFDTIRSSNSHGNLTTRVGSDLFVFADPLRLTQVIRNLVDNAAKYGGTHVEVAASDGGSGIEIRVSDDGKGIPEDRIEHVFAEFAQSSADQASKGFGLGLPIVKRLTEAMGGTVGYEKSHLGGACFVISLPKAAPVIPPVTASVG